MSKTGDFAIQGDTLVKYQGPGGDVVIPQGVVRIGREAFLDCAGLTSVALPAGVAEIGLLAFAGCLSLARVAASEILPSPAAPALSASISRRA